MPGESVEAFDALVQQLISELGPVGELELKLVERITVCLWRQNRVYRIESEILRAEYLKNEIDRLNSLATEHVGDTDELFLGSIGFGALSGFDAREKKKNEEIREKYLSTKDDARKIQQELLDADVGLGKAFQGGVLGADPLSKLSRYEAGIERAHYKALHELLRLQAWRSGNGVGVPQAIDIDVSTNT